MLYLIFCLMFFLTVINTSLISYYRKDIPKLNIILIFCSILVTLTILTIVLFEKNTVYLVFLIAIIFMIFNLYLSFTFFRIIEKGVKDLRSFFVEYKVIYYSEGIEYGHNLYVLFFKEKRNCILVPKNSKKLIKLNIVTQIIVFLITCSCVF